MKINAIQKHGISINIMGHPKETFLCSTCLELFLACSSLFKPAITCYWLFHFLQKTKSQNVLTYKFTVNQLLQKSASVIISGTAFLNYKLAQMVWYYKAGQVIQSRAIFITKWDNFYYKVRQ